jgi:uncharacterized ubiquitin-like protein YukD
MTSARDWPEASDGEHDYEHKCTDCGAGFMGHKGRVVCLSCAKASALGAVQIKVVPNTHADMEYPCHPETCSCPDYLLLVNGETFNSGDWDWCVSVGQKLRALLDIQTESLSVRVAELEGEAARNMVVAERLCEVYFTIAAEAIGEDEVRRKRDALIDAARGAKEGSDA